MATVILVHGTYESLERSAGSNPRWFDLDSEICQRIKEKSPNMKFDRFSWGSRLSDSREGSFKLGGDNSEAVRQSEGRRLSEYISKNYKDEDIVLIGHSHGGNIILNCLWYSILKKYALSNVKSVVLLARPAIAYRFRWNFYPKNLLTWILTSFFLLSFGAALKSDQSAKLAFEKISGLDFAVAYSYLVFIAALGYIAFFLARNFWNVIYGEKVIRFFLLVRLIAHIPMFGNFLARRISKRFNEAVESILNRGLLVIPAPEDEVIELLERISMSQIKLFGSESDKNHVQFEKSVSLPRLFFAKIALIIASIVVLFSLIIKISFDSEGPIYNTLRIFYNSVQSATQPMLETVLDLTNAQISGLVEIFSIISIVFILWVCASFFLIYGRFIFFWVDPLIKKLITFFTSSKIKKFALGDDIDHYAPEVVLHNQDLNDDRGISPLGGLHVSGTFVPTIPHETFVEAVEEQKKAQGLTSASETVQISGDGIELHLPKPKSTQEAWMAAQGGVSNLQLERMRVPVYILDSLKKSWIKMLRGLNLQHSLWFHNERIAEFVATYITKSVEYNAEDFTAYMSSFRGDPNRREFEGSRSNSGKANGAFAQADPEPSREGRALARKV